MFNVYAQHGKGPMIVLLPVETVGQVKEMAGIAARLGHAVLYRLFRQTGHYPNGEPSELFETAFSVLGGVVSEHRSATIPLAHW